MEIIDVTQSEIKAWRKCHAAHDFRYNQQLQLKRRKLQLLRGSILDEMFTARTAKVKRANAPYLILDAYAKKYATLLREEQEYYGETFIEDIRRIFENYERTYTADPLKYLGAQVELSYLIAPDVRLTVHIDKVAQRRVDGTTWILDHKTHKSIPDADQRFSDIQLVLYPWLWNKVYPKKPVTGICWDYVRAKPPSIPEQLKAGGLSRRKNIDTDWHTYWSEIDRLGLNIDDYRDMYDLLKDNHLSFFQRIYLPVPGEDRIKTIVDDLIQDARDKARGSKTKNLHWLCSSCDYFKICQAELHGSDVEFVRKTEYTKERLSAKEEATAND
jgi:hypothetical protein